MRYDFNCEAAVAALKEKGINAQTVIPGVSIYAPSAVMINRYNTAKKDAEQLFLDYVLSDEAAAAFAKFGARPILYVLGKQELPAEATANWLPEEDYKDVMVIEDFTSIDANAISPPPGTTRSWVASSEGITLESGRAAVAALPHGRSSDRRAAGWQTGCRRCRCLSLAAVMLVAADGCPDLGQLRPPAGR